MGGQLGEMFSKGYSLRNEFENSIIEHSSYS